MLWELAFERIPYENYTIEEIHNHVAVERKREVIYENIDDEKQEKKLYFETIISAWRDDFTLRPSLQNIFLKLNEAYLLVKQEKLEFKHKNCDHKSIVDSKSLLNINELKIGYLMPIQIDEGIIAHKKKNYKLAFDCFEYHANLGSPLAMYWKAYYLYDGRTGVKNIELARKLFKKVADLDDADAQLRYAFSLLDEQRKLPQQYEQEFAKYIRLSAYNDNVTAQYNLGDMYIKGMYIEQNKKLGAKFINIAAIRNHPKAVDYFKN
ncbi:hypothetical protein C1646_778299 [Rhizophagus diaphanus]|nr:hypothetical protein C1646_778299 [Rhizophagus diaphanus] [Rhizophagus sp. MUCL 43196]